MAWARIELEFMPERQDPNDVMAMLVEYFKADDGAPTATIRLTGIGPEDEPPIVLNKTQQARLGLTRTAQTLGVRAPLTPVHGIMLPVNPTQSEIEAAADLMVAHHTIPQKGLQKIQAIKDFRSISNLGLKESKDQIDAAERRTKGQP